MNLDTLAYMIMASAAEHKDLEAALYNYTKISYEVEDRINWFSENEEYALDREAVY